ncbi:hypothetical protein C9J85_02830 [Haloferax sp. wsp5]|nr:hypothetical protein C9J85_02830 [Haloferax sp. wsp5]
MHHRLTEPAQQRGGTETAATFRSDRSIDSSRTTAGSRTTPTSARRSTSYKTRDTPATRGALMGPFDTVRSIIEDAADSMDGPDSVPSALKRLADKL